MIIEVIILSELVKLTHQHAIMAWIEVLEGENRTLHKYIGTSYGTAQMQRYTCVFNTRVCELICMRVKGSSSRVVD